MPNDFFGDLYYRVAKGTNKIISHPFSPVQPESIEKQIDHQHRASQKKLNVSRQTCRIDDWQQVVLDEALRVARLASLEAEEVLGIGEWADATGDLDEKSPCGCRKVHDGEPTPARRKCGTQKDEQDESQMEKQDGVGKKTVKHNAGDTMIDAPIISPMRRGGRKLVRAPRQSEACDEICELFLNQ